MANDDTGSRIRTIREKLGMTQDEFGAKLGRSGGAISLYEKGDAQPPILILSKIALLSDVSVEWLIMGKEVSLNKLMKMLDDGEKSLLEAYSHASPDRKTLILDVAMALSEKK
jgi:transcriptional regulator with XRE-family HTH domain